MYPCSTGVPLVVTNNASSLSSAGFRKNLMYTCTSSVTVTGWSLYSVAVLKWGDRTTPSTIRSKSCIFSFSRAIGLAFSAKDHSDATTYRKPYASCEFVSVVPAWASMTRVSKYSQPSLCRRLSSCSPPEGHLLCIHASDER